MLLNGGNSTGVLSGRASAVDSASSPPCYRERYRQTKKWPSHGEFGLLEQYRYSVLALAERSSCR